MNTIVRPPLQKITENDLRLLRIFRAVADAGGLTAAETVLHMERSTISRHVQSLEIKLGGALCVRGPSGFELTDLGRTALHAAITACDTLDQVRDDLNRARNIVTGDLMVGLADNCLTNPAARIVEAIARFREEAPAARLHLFIKTPDQLASELVARHLHLAVIGAPIGFDKLEGRSLFDEEFRLYIGGGTQAAGLHLSQLFEQGYLLVSRDCDRHSLALASRFNIERRVTASGLEAVATLLASGGCVGFLPTHLASALSRIQKFREVQGAEEFAYTSEFSLVWERQRPLSPAGELLSKILTECRASAPDPHCPLS